MTNEEINLMFQQIVALYKEKKYDQCLAMLENLESSLPQNKDVLYHKALCLASLRRFDEASACCLNLKGQFSDNRVEELEQWIMRNTPSTVSKRFQEIKSEGNAMQGARDPQAESRAMPPSGAQTSMSPFMVPTMFCPKCGTENDKNSYKCSWCGGVLHPAPQTIESGPFTSSPQLEKLEKRANISFLTAIIGWLCGSLVFGLSAIIGAEGKEPSPAIAILVLGLLGISFLLCIISVIFGIMGMKADNTVNRWKAIAGLVMGILGVGSMACCFFLVILAIIAQFTGGEFPMGGGLKPR
jgi:hypothetical protein